MNQKQENRHVSTAWQWLEGNWQYGGVVAGAFYLANLPLLNVRCAVPGLLLWLQLPIYVVHQFEEHQHDRFRRYVNLHMGHGQPILSPRAVTVINVGGVWCVNFLALYLAKFCWLGSGLLAFYLAIVNAVVHVAGAIASRAYNPGLVTAATLLLPIGIWGAIVYSAAYALPLRDHVTALALIIALHLAILSHLVRQRAHFAQSS
jgi:hypothetical protein